MVYSDIKCKFLADSLLKSGHIWLPTPRFWKRVVMRQYRCKIGQNRIYWRFYGTYNITIGYKNSQIDWILSSKRYQKYFRIFIKYQGESSDSRIFSGSWYSNDRLIRSSEDIELILLHCIRNIIYFQEIVSGAILDEIPLWAHCYQHTWLIAK